MSHGEAAKEERERERERERCGNDDIHDIM